MWTHKERSRFIRGSIENEGSKLELCGTFSGAKKRFTWGSSWGVARKLQPCWIRYGYFIWWIIWMRFLSCFPTYSGGCGGHLLSLGKAIFRQRKETTNLVLCFTAWDLFVWQQSENYESRIWWGIYTISWRIKNLIRQMNIDWVTTNCLIPSKFLLFSLF